MVERSLEVNIGFRLHPVPYREMLIPSASIHNAFQTCNITALESAPADGLLPILPSLVRLAVCPPSLDKSDFWYRQSKRFTQLISGFSEANLITPLFELDYSAIEEDALKCIAFINKLATVEGTSSAPSASVLIGRIRDTAQLDFERSTADRRMRLLTDELIRLFYQAAPYVSDKYVPSELFVINPSLPILSRLLVQLTHHLPSLLPLPELCEALLRVEPGAELVCSVVANNPNEFESILLHILSRDESQEDHAQLNPLRVKCLCLLCAMCPPFFSILRRRCVQLRKHLTIAFILAIEESRLLDISARPITETDPSFDVELPTFSLEDLLSPPLQALDPVLDFLSALLTQGEENGWIALYFKQTLRKNVPSRVFNSVKQHIIHKLLRAIPEVGEVGKDIGSFRSPQLDPTESDSPSEAGETEMMEVEGSTCKVSVYPFSPTKFSHAAAVLRVFCVLRKLCPLPFNQNETDVIFNLIVTPALSASHSAVEFLKVSLGVLIICPVFYNTEDKERLVLEWYHQVLQLLPRIEEDNQDFQMRELLLTISSLFHNSSYQELSEVISDVMSIPLRNKSYQMNRSKELFLKIFTEEKCNQMMLTLPPTPDLNANHTDKLSIQSLLDFLKKKKKKKPLPVSYPTDWIFNQLVHSSLPLHPTLLLLLREYTAIIIQEGKPDLLFPRDDVVHLYSDTSLIHDRRLAPQLLLLFYLLTLFSEETLHPSSPVMLYAVSILEQVPIKILLSKAIRHASHCSELYPVMLKLVLHSLPQLWIPQNVLREFNGIYSGDKLDSKCRPKHLERTPKQHKHHTNHNVIFVILKQLLRLHVDKLREFLPVLVDLIPTLLSADISRQTQNIYLSLWERLESVEPRKLWLATANSLSSSSERLKHEELAQDPLLILHCDPRVFRVPPIYSLLLDTLAAYLAASKVHLYRLQRQREQEERPSQSQDGMAPHELRHTIISTQESATIQLLIEVCMPTEDDNANLSPFGIQLTNLTEIQCLSCSLINQMIIADPNLARIIHIQGYPSHMIEMLVQGVPSMHICTDFIPDLLEETDDPSNTVFCVQLTACLCEQYPLHKAIGVCQKVLEFLSKRVRHLDSKGRTDVFKPMLTSLIHLAKTFPTLSEDITNLLLVVMKLEQAITPETVVSRDASKERLGENTSLAQAVADTFDVLLDEVVLRL